MTRRVRPGWAMALLVALGLCACGSTPSAGPTPQPAAPSPTTSSPADASAPPTDRRTPTSRPTAAVRCAAAVRAMSVAEQVGQLFMVGMDSGGLSSATAEILRRERIGSVLLLGNSTAGQDAVRQVTDAVRKATRQPSGVRVLLAADQEGGQVQRLQGAGFDAIPSAVRQADESDRRLTARAKTWGEQLRDAGIDADLAPVADVVPTAMRRVNQPIGVLDRGYGADPDVVSAKVQAVVRGLDDAGVATAVKHFPGLGRVRGNTDFEAHVVDSTTTRDDPYLEGFAGAVRAGVDMVMVSSAYYSKIDDDRRAAFSKVVIGGMIRKDLGFDGVVISDDLAAQAVRDLTPGERALRFFEAGGDLVIVGDPTQASAMVKAVRDEAEDDDGFAAAVEASAVRVVRLKERRGLADC